VGGGGKTEGWSTILVVVFEATDDWSTVLVVVF
jgi:hypothetical protein